MQFLHPDGAFMAVPLRGVTGSELLCSVSLWASAAVMFRMFRMWSQVIQFTVIATTFEMYVLLTLETTRTESL